MAEQSFSEYRVVPIDGDLSIISLGTFDVVIDAGAVVSVKEDDINDQYPEFRRLGYNPVDSRKLHPMKSFSFFFDFGVDSDAVYNSDPNYTGNIAGIKNSTTSGRVHQLVSSNTGEYYMQSAEFNSTAVANGIEIKGYNIGSHKVPLITGSRKIKGYMHVHVVDPSHSAPTYKGKTIEVFEGSIATINENMLLTDYSSVNNSSPWKIKIENASTSAINILGYGFAQGMSLPWEAVQSGGIIIDATNMTSGTSHTLYYRVSDVTSKKYGMEDKLTINIVKPSVVINPPLYIGLTTYTVQIGSRINISHTQLMASIPEYFQDINLPMGSIEIIGYVGGYKAFLDSGTSTENIGRLYNKNVLISKSSESSAILNKDVAQGTLRGTGTNGFQVLGVAVGSGIIKFRATAISGTTESVMSSVTGEIKINVTSANNLPPSQLSNSTINCYSGGQVILHQGLFSTGYLDPEADAIGFLKIATIPSAPNNVLSYQGQDLTVPNSILAWDNVQNGSLSYFDAGNQAIGTSITIQFTVADVGSGQYFAVNRTLTITIVAPPVIDPVPPLPPLPNGVEVVASTLIPLPSYGRDISKGDISEGDPWHSSYAQLDFRDFTTNMFPYDYNARKLKGGKVIRFGYYNILDPLNVVYVTSAIGTQYLKRGRRDTTPSTTTITTSTLLTEEIAWSLAEENVDILDIGTHRNVTSGKYYMFVQLKEVENFISSFPDPSVIVPFFDIALDYDGYGMDVTRLRRVAFTQFGYVITSKIIEFASRNMDLNSPNRYRYRITHNVPHIPDPVSIHYGDEYDGGLGMEGYLGIKWFPPNSMAPAYSKVMLDTYAMYGYDKILKHFYPELNRFSNIDLTFSPYGMVAGVRMGAHPSNPNSFKRLMMGGEEMINGTTVSMQHLRAGVFAVDSSSIEDIIYSYLIRGSVTGAIVNSENYY